MARYSEKNNKTVYITFNEGPSINVTKEILRILKDNNVRGTFFVKGEVSSLYPHLIKALDENKMCIMPYCNTNDYKSIYKNEEAYFKDLVKCRKNINKIIGEKNMSFIRIPGGSENELCTKDVLLKIKANILNKGYNYIDWTIDAKDKESFNVSSEQIKSKVRDEGMLYNVEVILMHDSGMNNSTVEALQYVIDIYKERGYTFKALDEIEPWEIEYLKEINVLNKK